MRAERTATTLAATGRHGSAGSELAERDARRVISRDSCRMFTALVAHPSERSNATGPLPNSASMARSRNPNFGVSVRLNFGEMHSAMIRNIAAATASGSWPGRPHPRDRIADTILDDLRAVYAIPSVMRGILNPMTLLEHALVHGKEAIAAERRAPDLGLRKRQVEMIARAKIGDPMPTGLEDDVYHLLTGAAVRDLRLGANDWLRIAEIGEHVRNLTVVTELARDWATWLIMFGSTSRRSHRKHGGGSLQAELTFVSSLLNFWIDDLGRKLTTWVSSRDPHSAAQLTCFVRDCLHNVGVNAHTAAKRKKIGLSPTSLALSPRRISLYDSHQRILRVKSEFRAAEAAGLTRNYLSRQLNPLVSAP
jgi:hypothetical protein